MLVPVPPQAGAGRDLTADEAQRLDGLNAQFGAIENELRLANGELAAAEAEEVASTPQPTPQ